MPTFEFFLDSRGLLTKEFEIDVTATLPKVTVQVLDGDDPVDLTGAAVTFTLRDATGAAVVLDAAAVLLNATQGIVEYQLKSADVDDVGFFFAQFKITISGESYLIPNDSTQRLRLRIGKEDLPAFSSVPATLPVHAGSHDLGGSDQIALEALNKISPGTVWVNAERDPVAEGYIADGSWARPFDTVEDGVAASYATRGVSGSPNRHRVAIAPGEYEIPPAKLPIQLTSRIFIGGESVESTIIRVQGTGIDTNIFEIDHQTGAPTYEFYDMNILPQKAGNAAILVKTAVSRLRVRNLWCQSALAETGVFVIKVAHPSGTVRIVVDQVNQWTEIFNTIGLETGIEFNVQSAGDCLVAFASNFAEFKMNSVAVAADVHLANCRVSHEKITGGEKTQKIFAVNCFSDGGVVGGRAPLDAQDFQGEQTFENVDSDKTISEIHDLAAATFSDTVIQIPDGAVVSKISVRVIDAVTTSSGTDTFDVGVLGATTRYGAGFTGAAGNKQPSAARDGTNDRYTAAAAIRLSAPGIETFTAGKISVAITHSAP